MRHDKRNILITKPLNGPQIEYARVLGLEPIIVPALEFDFPTYWDKVLKIINKHPKSDWVFTSSNGVKALEQLVKEGLRIRPETNIFAVGSRTRKTLQELGLDAKIPRAQDAEHLAELIIKEDKVNSVIYFHGNLSRDTLANKLTQKDIEVIWIEVYKTVIKPVKMPSSPVSAILFYSPSAVEGFKYGQGFKNHLPPLFAIGPTTAQALRSETGPGIEINLADKPDTEMLLRSVANYLFSRSDAV